MKKILFILLMFPVVVFGDTCDFIKDTSTGDTRNLVCDTENRTTTSFKTTNEKILIDNSVCTVKCTEEIVFSIDPMKKVLSGTSFNYPLYASGIRKCTAEYNYEQYETKIKTLVNEYANLTGSEKQTKANEITNYYDLKKQCDDFAKQDSEYVNKYKYVADGMELKIETSTSEITVPYIFKEIDEYSSSLTLDETNYNSCNFNETNNTCLNSKKTIAGWTETARIYGKFTMNDTYLEKYTGEIKNTNEGNTCNVGDRYFVKYDEITRPVKNDPTDKGYKLTLVAPNLGINKNWNLNIDCWYQVKNLLFPQSGKDENYDEYGGTAFQYRIIDLANPFPKAQNDISKMPANWVGYRNVISENISNLERFEITLDRTKIKNIKEYNEEQRKSGKYYNSFDIEIKEIDGKKVEYSSFIYGDNGNNNKYGIDRK